MAGSVQMRSSRFKREGSGRATNVMPSSVAGVLSSTCPRREAGSGEVCEEKGHLSVLVPACV